MTANRPLARETDRSSREPTDAGRGPWPRDRFRSALLSRRCTLPTSQRLVAIAISEYATRWERAQVSHAGLMAATGLSQSSIARAIRGLCTSGWIEVLVEAGGGRQTGTFLMIQQGSSRQRDDSEGRHSDDSQQEEGRQRDESPATESRHGDVESRHGDVESRHGDDQSQESSQSSSHRAGARDLAALVEDLARTSSLPRDREAEDAVDWLVREFSYPLDEARTFVDGLPSSVEHPLRYLQKWDPADISRKRRAPKPSAPSRSDATHCSHGYRRRKGAEPDEICCVVGERELRAEPRVRDGKDDDREAS